MPKRKGKRLTGPQWKRVIGLTGAFGSGKSTALMFFKQRGIKTLDSDKIVHDLFKNKAVQKKILNTLGVLKREDLARIVFKKPSSRRQLEKILHPLVEKRMRDELKKKGGRMVVCDVPLLFEAGWGNRFDQTVFIDAAPGTRAKRLRQRGFTPVEIKARLKAQWPVARKRKQADVVVRNDGSVSDLKKRISDLIADLIA